MPGLVIFPREGSFSPGRGKLFPGRVKFAREAKISIKDTHILTGKAKMFPGKGKYWLWRG
jgi:hypothetical protein